MPVSVRDGRPRACQSRIRWLTLGPGRFLLFSPIADQPGPVPPSQRAALLIRIDDDEDTLLDLVGYLSLLAALKRPSRRPALAEGN